MILDFKSPPARNPTLTDMPEELFEIILKEVLYGQTLRGVVPLKRVCRRFYHADIEARVLASGYMIHWVTRPHRPQQALSASSENSVCGDRFPMSLTYAIRACEVLCERNEFCYSDFDASLGNIWSRLNAISNKSGENVPLLPELRRIILESWVRVTDWFENLDSSINLWIYIRGFRYLGHSVSTSDIERNPRLELPVILAAAATGNLTVVERLMRFALSYSEYRTWIFRLPVIDVLLMISAAMGHPKVVELIAPVCFEVSQDPSRLFTTALQLAARYGHFEIVRLLNAQDLYEAGELGSPGVGYIQACLGKHWDIADFIMNAVDGAGQDTVELSGWFRRERMSRRQLQLQEALWDACYYGSSATIQRLCSQGATLQSSYWPKDQLYLLKYLLSHDMSARSRQNRNDRALEQGRRQHRRSTTKKFFRYKFKADTNTDTQASKVTAQRSNVYEKLPGCLPAVNAVAGGHVEALQTLLDLGANLQLIRDEIVQTTNAEHLTVRMAKFLLSLGIDLSPQTIRKGKQPGQEFDTINHHLKLRPLIIERKDACSTGLLLLLHYADSLTKDYLQNQLENVCLRCDAEGARLLSKHGINFSSERSKKVLLEMAHHPEIPKDYEDTLDVVRFLVEHGANVNGRYIGKQSIHHPLTGEIIEGRRPDFDVPLHAVANANENKVADALIELGATPATAEEKTEASSIFLHIM